MTPPKAKTAITIDADVLARVRSAVEAGQARSVSAYIEHAATSQLAAEASFDSWLAHALEATGGEPTDQERAAARPLPSDTAA